MINCAAVDTVIDRIKQYDPASEEKFTLEFANCNFKITITPGGPYLVHVNINTGIPIMDKCGNIEFKLPRKTGSERSDIVIMAIKHAFDKILECIIVGRSLYTVAETPFLHRNTSEQYLYIYEMCRLVLNRYLSRSIVRIIPL